MDEQEALTIENKPALRKPYIVCGIDGWVNGGDVSTGGLDYLIRHLKAVKFAHINTTRFHVYQVPGAEGLRPFFKMEDGLIVETTMPKDQFYYSLNPNSEHDLILFTGTEPNLHWEEYTDSIVNLAADFGAVGLYTFGGILDRSPYTRSPRVSCTCTDARTKAEMEGYNVSFSSRQGAASFNLMLLYACKKRQLSGANLTVRVPYYPEFNVAIEYGSKSVKAVLARLDHLLQLDLDFAELDQVTSELEGKLDFVRQQNAQFNAYIEELEKHYVEMPYEGQLDLSAKDAVKFAEEFLKGHKDKPNS